MTASRTSAAFAACLILAVAVVLGLAAPALAAAPLTSPDGMWTWSRPVSQGYSSTGMFAPVPGTLFQAIGMNDALVASEDGDAWSWSRTGLSSRFGALADVTFISPQEGWLAGAEATNPVVSAGVLLHTIDGGRTWQRQLTTPGVTFRSVIFADPSSGWAQGSKGDSLFAASVLYVTGDGGRTWASVALPDAQEQMLQFFFGQGLLTPLGPGKALWAEASMGSRGDLQSIVTHVWRTDDAGAHWRRTAVVKDLPFVSFAFSSPTSGYAVTFSGAVWSTTDGGSTWRLRRSSSRQLGGGAIACVGDQVWIAGDGVVLHSADRGHSWDAERGGALTGIDCWNVVFANELDGWIKGDGEALLHTVDGGQSWSRVTNSPKPAVTKLSAVPDGSVWGAANYVVKSPDGGQHWLRVTQKRRLTAVAAVSSQEAWAVGQRGRAMHTTDGGATWRTRQTGMKAYLLDVCFVGAAHGWIAAANGTVARTVDAGRHWVKTRTGGAAVRRVIFTDVSHGLALTEGATILRTSDGGRTWSSSRLSPSSEQPLAAAFKDAATGVLISIDMSDLMSAQQKVLRRALDPTALLDATGPLVDRERLFGRSSRSLPGGQTIAAHSWRTADGGLTWQRGADLPSWEIYMDAAYSGSELRAVGALGGVATSSDDGAVWSFAGYPAGLGVALASVQFLGAGTVMVGGQNGAVLTAATTAAQN